MMSMNMDYATQQAAETISDLSERLNHESVSTELEQAACPKHAIEVPAATRKVWHEFLAQHDVAAAVLSVVLPSQAPQRYAFLIGFDSFRNDHDTTRHLLSFAERVWLHLSDQPSLQFQTINFGSATLDLPDQRDMQAITKLLAGFDRGVAAQRKHNGATIRAVYLRHKGLDRFTAREVGSLQLILPLLADSAARGAQLTRQSQRSEMLEAMFDRVSLSMVMLSADSQPLFMNSSAGAMLDERNWLIRSADGSIACTDQKQAKKLRESIKLAAAADNDAPVEDVYRIDGRNGEWRLAYVLSAMSRSGDIGTRCALLFVLTPGKMDAPTQMLEALGLLPSEQRFLGHFLKASSLCNAAEDCGLSEETARTYLKRVRAKLGVHRQMELAGLISGLVLPLHHSGHPAIGV
jgi:PAS domain-containing protein